MPEHSRSDDRRLLAGGVERLIGGDRPVATGAARPTVQGECTGCHVIYRVDVRVQRPVCPDCDEPVLLGSAHAPSLPRSASPPAVGFNRPRLVDRDES